MAGTFGAIVEAGGKLFILSNNHVLANENALPLGSPLRRTLLVSADMLGVEEFRRLRLWALWNRLPGVAPKQLAA